MPLRKDDDPAGETKETQILTALHKGETCIPTGLVKILLVKLLV